MITNERQHRITRAEIRRFEEALSRAAAQAPSEIDPRIYQAMLEGLQSQLEDLRDEVQQYEALRNGDVRRRVIGSLADLPEALIELRIVRHLTQKELAKRLGLAEQQVQRYERTRYAGVAIERLQAVADAVGLDFKKTIDYSPRSIANARSSKGTSTQRKGGVVMAARKTGKAAASAAGKTLGSTTASKTAKRAAASDLAQVGNKKVTGKKAASAAGKTLGSKSASKTTKRAAASDLSQRARNKKR